MYVLDLPTASAVLPDWKPLKRLIKAEAPLPPAEAGVNENWANKIV
jgi:hypothetical protein